MKKMKANLLLLLGMIVLFSACTDDNDELVGRLEGTWMVSEVVAAESNPNNLSLPSSGTIKFMKCSDQSESRCDGNFSFDQETEVPFDYSAYSSTNKNINILPDLQVPVSYYMTGSWEVLTLEESRLVIKGPLQIQQPDETFQKLDVKMTLAK